MGFLENVEEVIDYIFNLEEEYLVDVVDSEVLQVYMKFLVYEEVKVFFRGFVVWDVFWIVSSSEKVFDMSSFEEFFSFGVQVVFKIFFWGFK